MSHELWCEKGKQHCNGTCKFHACAEQNFDETWQVKWSCWNDTLLKIEGAECSCRNRQPAALSGLNSSFGFELFELAIRFLINRRVTHDPPRPILWVAEISTVRWFVRLNDVIRPTQLNFSLLCIALTSFPFPSSSPTLEQIPEPSMGADISLEEALTPAAVATSRRSNWWRRRDSNVSGGVEGSENSRWSASITRNRQSLFGVWRVCCCDGIWS